MSTLALVPKTTVLIVVEDPGFARPLEDSVFESMPDADIRLMYNVFTAVGDGAAEAIASHVLSICTPDVVIFKVRHREMKCLEVMHWIVRRLKKPVKVFMHSIDYGQGSWRYFEVHGFIPSDRNPIEFQNLLKKGMRK